MIGFGKSDLERAGLDKALGRDPALFIAGGHDFAGREQAPPDLAALRAWLPDAATRVQALPWPPFRNPQSGP